MKSYNFRSFYFFFDMNSNNNTKNSLSNCHHDKYILLTIFVMHQTNKKQLSFMLKNLKMELDNDISYGCEMRSF